MLYDPPNFLVLDEPTNHLDMDTKATLERALENFAGTMLMVSHDRHFLHALSDHVLELTPEGPRTYTGGYAECVVASGHEAPGLWDADRWRNSVVLTCTRTANYCRRSRSHPRRLLLADQHNPGLLDSLVRQRRFDEPLYITRPTMPELADYSRRLEPAWKSAWLTNKGSLHDELKLAH